MLDGDLCSSWILEVCRRGRTLRLFAVLVKSRKKRLLGIRNINALDLEEEIRNGSQSIRNGHGSVNHRVLPVFDISAIFLVNGRGSSDIKLFDVSRQ